MAIFILNFKEVTMKLFNFRNKEKNEEIETRQSDDFLLKSVFKDRYIGEREAMNIPAVSRCVSLISSVVSMIPIKLYKEEFKDGKRKTVEVEDERCDLFNLDTKDTLDGVQFKRALVRDYLLFGGAYAYINKKRNAVKSLHYVDHENVYITENFETIFKDYNILVQGQSYKPFEFLKVLRFTKDGAHGLGIIEENKELLKVAYLTLKFEQSLVSTGGSKKGFIKSEKKITKEAMDSLKKAWRELYCNTENNVIVLNDNLDFKDLIYSISISISFSLSTTVRFNSSFSFDSLLYFLSALASFLFLAFSSVICLVNFSFSLVKLAFLAFSSANCQFGIFHSPASSFLFLAFDTFSCLNNTSYSFDSSSYLFDSSSYFLSLSLSCSYDL